MLKGAVNIARLIVGLLFIFSGFIKANDPLGFAYKLEDYFAVFNLTSLNSFALTISIAICIIEIVLGISVLLGTLINLTASLLLLMIVFFTLLTGYSAITGSVTDCGCFGDAIKLTPWQSFIKDVILLLLIELIFIKKNYVSPLLSKMASSFILITATLISTSFTLLCYHYLPFIDFRPYKVGNNIHELMQIPEGAAIDVFEIKFYYKNTNTGEIKEFTASNLPTGNEWSFHDRKETLIKEGYKPPIHDFSIMDESGEDFAESILTNPDNNFMLIAYDLKNSSLKNKEKIHNIIEECKKQNIRFIALTASTADEVAAFKQQYGIDTEFYFCDATALKTVVRSNPGLLLLKKGTVINMWHCNKFPDFSDIEFN